MPTKKQNKNTQGYVSGPDYSGKRTLMVLFINGRPVDCGPLRRAVEGAYAAILPKAAKPFLFLVSALPLRGVRGRGGCC